MIGKERTETSALYFINISVSIFHFRYRRMFNYTMSEWRDVYRSSKWIYMLMRRRIYRGQLWHKWVLIIHYFRKIKKGDYITLNFSYTLYRRSMLPLSFIHFIKYINHKEQLFLFLMIPHFHHWYHALLSTMLSKRTMSNCIFSKFWLMNERLRWILLLKTQLASSMQFNKLFFNIFFKRTLIKETWFL